MQRVQLLWPQIDFILCKIQELKKEQIQTTDTAKSLAAVMAKSPLIMDSLVYEGCNSGQITATTEFSLGCMCWIYLHLEVRLQTVAN